MMFSAKKAIRSLIVETIKMALAISALFWFCGLVVGGPIWGYVLLVDNYFIYGISILLIYGLPMSVYMAHWIYKQGLE